MSNVFRTIAHDGEGQGAEQKLQLVVVEGESVTVHDLPAAGSILVGRGEGVDVQLGDPGASARHARVHVEAGGGISIEDLESRNGVQLKGQRIAAGERAPLAPGEAAMLGGSILLVQRRSKALQQRRALPHGYFELRLAEECELARSQRGETSFSVARLDVDRALSAEAFAEEAAGALRPSDIIGTYGPNAFEILLRRTPADKAQATLEPLLKKLQELGARPRLALAHFPADGQTAHALIDKACAGLRAAPAGNAPPGVIVRDEKMLEVYRLADKAAAATISVLVLGETGVGKEVLAETIHRRSKRAEGPFLCLNCAALPDNLLESELFGYERGSFTDAKNAKAGLLESASGGTVFLDEIGEMSAALQAKLLRVIQSKQVTRLGGLKPITIDVRFVSATHRDLVQEISEKRFRSDLYYRLNGLRLEIPPLRERPSEIRPLAESFLAELAKQAGHTRRPGLTQEALAILEGYEWPGNIRELHNVMERALLLSDGGDIGPEHLPLETLRAEPSSADVADPILDDDAPEPGRWQGEEAAERARIVEALRLEGGNQSRAARRLGISRSTLIVRLDHFQISRPQKGRG
jgi:DNA-binding NtrC family response regulator/pSer/pThr/pTyr-binding forkhead associated (FHA) protein